MKRCTITCNKCENIIKDYRPLEVTIIYSNGLKSSGVYHYCMECEGDMEKTLREILNKKMV